MNCLSFLIEAGKIPVISSIGKNTLVIFLLHGFVKKYLESAGGVFIYSKYANMGLAILISSAIVLVFGNGYVGVWGKWVFTGEGIGKIIRYVRKKMKPYGKERLKECK